MRSLDHSRRVVEQSLLRLKWLAAAANFELALHRYARALKAYNPDQPRVPAGSSDGGQWADAGGGGGGLGTKPTSTRRINDPRVLSDVMSDNTWKPGAQYAQNDTSRPGRDRAEGHHYVPRSLYDKLPLSEETRKVFDESKTGRLYDERSNRYDTAHRHYNDAVKEHFERFIDRNKTQPEQMTPDQARSFLKEVMESRDPRIRQFNMRIQLREIMRRVFRGARGLD